MTTVIVRTDVVGYHAWEGAPPHRAYLGTRHRHVFKFEVGVRVDHRDRQVEFHDLLDSVHKSLRGSDANLIGVANFEGRSCEMIANELVEMLTVVGYSVAYVEVWEDGENGARVEP
jgi:hypothetical protein